MSTKIKPTQNQINTALWNACDTFRGAFDSSEYKNYILVFMFQKYLSDVWKDHYNQLKEQYGGDEELIQRKLKRERFVLPENCTFDYIYEHRNDTNIGEKIDKIFAQIEERNIEKLNGVFRNISFNSDKLGQTKDRNRRLKNLINDFAKPELDFRPSLWEDKEDILGEAYMFLLEKFASGAGKKGGEFFTPKEVSGLLAKLVAPKEGDRIFDPTCGSGSLLIKVAEETKDADGEPTNNFAIYGQESNGDTWALSKMNCFLHSMDSAQIEWCDTINNPKLIEGDALMKFDIVVANPPFSLDKWGHENAEADRFKRFFRGVPPKSKGDYAFIQHMIETTAPGGRVGVIVPHGVLFRGSAEQKIRQQLIEENLLEAVIGLPTNLFYGTGIPAAILIFNKAKTTEDILFIDASKDYEDGKRQNKLRPQDIEKIVDTYTGFKTIKKFSAVVPPEEVAENDFNLNIPRYVDTFEEEEPVDIVAVQQHIERLEEELVVVRAEMQKHLKELGY
ncbi:MAG: type I restriction-modification system subunit M [Leeuwenhoekiella sp.]|uniref:type I restriction-modification system subunit M n=1 Tax=Leeuwenhoekiella TaxID=283735 RepID=UPI000C66EF02|nr:type I restriction-modification system subunit M [Leeuwenhoekiella blandensis]MBQ52841.1 type I restriction-modification system subunit M [Leeuwenhoekiella sp.]HCW63301.1 type I restriction-modification system subunit M [Leeuwenhoekiella sp.]|tara:strand:+ start:2100 stop:3614 length:1515 start_codon:yes stop_codon:yes gene_type:complete